jgi:hypothetical protein
VVQFAESFLQNKPRENSQNQCYKQPKIKSLTPLDTSFHHLNFLMITGHIAPRLIA